MKKILLLFISLIVFTLKAPAAVSRVTFEEAFNEVNRTPMLVLVYANWADDYRNCLNTFRELEDIYGDTFNFVELNIASEETRAFNARFKIDQNLPYVLMFRDGGKISRYLNSECLLNESCISSRIKSFIQ